jgi:hypothetical protein
MKNSANIVKYSYYDYERLEKMPSNYVKFKRTLSKIALRVYYADNLLDIGR